MSLFLKNINDKNNKSLGMPIAIVRAEGKKIKNSINHNKLLYLLTEPKNNKHTGENEVILPQGEEFEILPSIDENKRQLYYIAGASGSGKSYITVKIIQNYQRLYPNRNIFVVSGLDEDETLDKIKGIIRLQPDDIDNLDINNSTFSNSFFIFDDWENMENKKGIERVLTDILIMGRKHKEGQGNISCCVLSHQINRGRGLGTLILNECSHYILYPTSTSHHSLNYILSKYVGLEEKEVRALKKIKSRWVCIHKNYPNYLISSYSAKLLHTD